MNRSGNDSGAVYIFKKEGSSWLQHTYLKASNANPLDEFGTSLSLSADGDTLVVGAPNESSNAKGVNGDELNNASQSSGAVYVFKQNNHVWQQHAYLKASNTKAGDNFGSSLSISPDGNTLAVAAKNEDSDAKGVNGIETNKSAVDSGAVYLFKQTGEAWQQDAYLKASNTGAGDNFGHSLSLNADGNILAVGGVWEDSNGTGLNGDQSNNEINKAGATYLFKNGGNAWQQQAYLKPALGIEGSEFGYSVSLSADGNTLAVGTRYDSYGKHVSTVYPSFRT